MWWSSAAGSSGWLPPTRWSGAAPRSSCSSAGSRAAASRPASRAASGTCTRRAQQIWRGDAGAGAWDEWSARAGEPLVGDEGALRLGGDVEADAAELRAVGVAAVGAGAPRGDGAGPLLWDPRGGAIRARRAIEWLAAELGDRIRRTEALSVAPGRVDGVARAVTSCSARARAPSGCGRAWRCGGSCTCASRSRRRGEPLPTWADRSGRFGEVDLRRRGRAAAASRSGWRTLDAQPAAERGGGRSRTASTSSAIRERIHAYARAAFPRPGRARRRGRAAAHGAARARRGRVRPPQRAGLTVVAGHNLFKLAPILGEEVA